MDTISKRNFTFQKFLTTDVNVEGCEDRISPHGGRYLPFDLIFRDLNVGTFSAGGALTAPKIDDKIVGPYRPLPVCATLGADIRFDLKPDMIVPILTSDFSPAWLAEYQASTAADLSAAQALLTAHRASASVVVANLLLNQSSPDFEADFRGQIALKLLQTLDSAALVGTGGVQPLGLINQPGTIKTAFGGAPNWSSVLQFEKLLGNANAEPAGARLGFAVSVNTRYVFKNTPRTTNGSTFLMSDDGTIGGALSAATTELTTDQVIFGNWRDLLIAVFFGGCWITVDKMTLSKTGEAVIVAHLYADAGAKKPGSFVISTDGGAQ
jgi:HK97 family phage major capsid protein